MMDDEDQAGMDDTAEHDQIVKRVLNEDNNQTQTTQTTVVTLPPIHEDCGFALRPDYDRVFTQTE